LELGQQWFSTGRDAEWADMAMNVLGLLLGTWLARRQSKKRFAEC
jgi:VanZ family protein